MNNKEAADIIKRTLIILGRRNGKMQLAEALLKAHEVLEAAPDKMTTLVTLSDGYGHVREAYYDKGRQLVFTEWISVKDLDFRFININERKELSDSEVQDEDS